MKDSCFVYKPHNNLVSFSITFIYTNQPLYCANVLLKAY